MTTVAQGLEAGRDLDGEGSGAFDLDVSAMYDARVFRIGATIRNLRSPDFEGPEGLVRELERRPEPDRPPSASIGKVAARSRIRERAVAQLRTVAPAGHSFGRRR